MLFKLPLAYLGGVRVVSIEKETAIVNITNKWMNQNPFKSMFWAAQGMAAEMATGVLVMKGIENLGKMSPCWLPISVVISPRKPLVK